MIYGFCYIPPNDSQCFSFHSFPGIHGKISVDDGVNALCVVGVLNARFGKQMREMLVSSEISERENYTNILTLLLFG